jgi:hypothetical protein
MAKTTDEKFYLLTFNEDYADEHNVPALACMNEKEYKRWFTTRRAVLAHLGNGGDCFCEDLQGMTGKELIAKGYVGKTIVSKEFHKLFNKADLSELSLCGVFEEEYEEEEED